MPRAPAARAAPTSSHLSPTTNERAGSRPRSAEARSIMPQPGLRQSQRLLKAATVAVGVVGTIVIRVDARAARVEHRRHVPVQLLDDGLGEKSTRHARLIRDDDHGKAGLIEGADGVDGPREKRQVTDVAQVPDILDERAVAVEEDGGLSWAQGQSICRTAPTTRSTPMPRMHR